MSRIMERLARVLRAREITLRWSRQNDLLTMRWKEPEPPPRRESDRPDGTDDNVIPFRHVPRRPPIEPDGDPGPGTAA